jgi:cytochrome c
MEPFCVENHSQVKGTKVLSVPKRNLSFLAGLGGKYARKHGQYRGLAASLRGENEGIVNRLSKATGLLLFCGSLVAVVGLFAQSAPKKSGAANTAAVGRGKTLFQQKCAVCHYDNSDQKKIGPGLKGISKRGTFSVNGNKITDESLKTWIENGDQLMPPFKETLEAGQIKDLIAYVKTL